MNTVLLPGSFDPPTLGHQDVILRAASFSKKLIVGIACNTRKEKSNFSVKERIDFLKILTMEKTNIEIVGIQGLIVEFAKVHQINFLIRGLRTFSDMEAEFQMALANKKIGGLETLFLMADNKFAHISSSLIKEIAAYGHSLKDFVPAPIEKAVYERLSSQHDSFPH